MLLKSKTTDHSKISRIPHIFLKKHIAPILLTDRSYFFEKTDRSYMFNMIQAYFL